MWIIAVAVAFPDSTISSVDEVLDAFAGCDLSPFLNRLLLGLVDRNSFTAFTAIGPSFASLKGVDVAATEQKR